MQISNNISNNATFKAITNIHQIKIPSKIVDKRTGEITTPQKQYYLLVEENFPTSKINLDKSEKFIPDGPKTKNINNYFVSFGYFLENLEKTFNIPKKNFAKFLNSKEDVQIEERTNKIIRCFASDKPFNNIPNLIQEKEVEQYINDLNRNSEVKSLGKKTYSEIIKKLIGQNNEKTITKRITFADGVRKDKDKGGKWIISYCKSLIYDRELKTPLDFFTRLFKTVKLKNNELLTKKIDVPTRIEKNLREMLQEAFNKQAEIATKFLNNNAKTLIK